MPRRFFRKFAWKRDRFHGRWYLTPFAHLMHDPKLWGIARRNVVPAFALGLFVAFMPVPGHLLIAALAALALRVNIPIAALATLVTNPLTIGPIFYVAYRTGRRLLDLPPRPFSFELSFEWLSTQLATTWQPLLLGCVIFGARAALAGYVTLDLLWRASIASYRTERRSRRDRDS